MRADCAQLFDRRKAKASARARRISIISPKTVWRAEKKCVPTEVLFIQKSTVSSMFFVPIHPLLKVVLQVIENQHNSNRLVKGELLPPER